MDKICLLVIVLFAFIQCSKDKTPLPPKAKEEFAFLGKDSLLVGTWEWMYSYTKVKHFYQYTNANYYRNFAIIDKTIYNIIHKLEIKKNGTLSFFENGQKKNEINLDKIKLFKVVDTNAYYISYPYNDNEAFISFFILQENDSIKLKVDHSFLNFPVGKCSNDHLPISHNYLKI